MAKISVAGREKTLEPRAQAFRAESQRRHAAAQKAWGPASHPPWLDEDAYCGFVHHPEKTGVHGSEFCAAPLQGPTQFSEEAVRRTDG